MMTRIFKYCVVIFFISGCIFSFSCTKSSTEDLFSIDTDDLIQYFDNEGNSSTVLCTSEKEIFCEISDSSWCRVEIWTNQDEKKILINVLDNKRKELREADVLLKEKKEGKELAKIKIKQLGTNPMILVRQDLVEVANDLIIRLDITSNISLDFQTPEWISYSGSSENEKKSQSEYYFHVDKLPANQTLRKGEIIIEGLSLQKEVKREVTVIQTESLPRFIVISDVLIGRTYSKERLKQRLLSLLSTPKPVDAIFMVGDLTGRGASVQYEELKSICDSVISKDIPVYFMMGNTDHFLEKADVTFSNEMQQPIHQYFSIKGYPFVTLSMTGIYTDRFRQKDKDFLLNSFLDAQEKYPGKPIFFFTHIGMSDTFYGTEKVAANLGSDVLAPILVRFPNLIAFSGHASFPLGDPRSIHQKVFTSVNIGGGIHSQIEYGYTEGMYPPNYQNVSEGLVVNVQENGDVEIERWDTYRNEEILPKWLVKAPHDGSNFTYANRDGDSSPFFAEDDQASIEILKDGDFAVTFPAAADDEVVHHYIIEVLDNEKVIFQNTRFSQFYLNSNAPQEFTVKLLSLPENISLRAEIRAVDSYNNISKPLLSEVFSVQPFIPQEGTEIPLADMFDIQFGENGMAKDISPNHVSVSVGEVIPETYYNDYYGRYTAKFKGIKTSFYKVDYANNQSIKDAIEKGFALETVYMTNDLKNTAPLSGKEWEGLGIEQEVGGQIEFWAYLDDKYKKAKSSVFVEPGKYYHVVAMYDSNSAKMSIYVNGKKAGETEAPGHLLIPKQLDSRWFCIGGDTHPTGIIQHSLDGEVVIARMYSRTLSDDEVFLLYKNSNNQK
ncbi:metallophosphoesterase [Bacteroidales bacterium OttesenSCG-928-M06]|nr:metallophosphoesterase [Bacteroidales bacterium OttesenSCG-928-M06]